MGMDNVRVVWITREYDVGWLFWFIITGFLRHCMPVVETSILGLVFEEYPLLELK